MGGVGAATAFALLLGELGLASAIAAAFDDEDLDVVGQAVDQGDGAGGVGEDGVPVLEGQIGGDKQGVHDRKVRICRRGIERGLIGRLVR